MSDVIQELARRLPKLAITSDEASLAPFVAKPGAPDAVRPLAVLAPRDAPELQALVGAARAIGLRLVPVSSTGAHHRALPGAGRAAMVDLRAFNRIVRVDRRNRVFLTEAAVDFPTLAPELRRHGLRAMLPLAPRAGKSVLASYLEREPTIYPCFQWDLSDPLLCLEVIFGTGELFRTGSAAGPGTLEEQWLAGDAQKSPMGPGQSDLMRVVQGAQGTMGIVTWCSAKTEPLPTRETLHLVGSDRLGPLVRLAYGLMRRNHADILLILDAAGLAALQARDATEGERGRARARPWNLVFSVSDPQLFPEQKLAYVWREIHGLEAELALREEAAPPLGTMQALHERLTRPDLHRDRAPWRQASLDATLELGFHTTLDRADRFLEVADRVITKAGWPRERVLRYLQPQLGGRVCHVELSLPHATADAQRAAEVFMMLARAMKEAGAFFSRPYGPVVDLALDGSAGALLRRVKNLFDPDGILAPGRLEPSTPPAAPGGLHAVQ